jgi:hypothetical protein
VNTLRDIFAVIDYLLLLSLCNSVLCRIIGKRDSYIVDSIVGTVVGALTVWFLRYTTSSFTWAALIVSLCLCSGVVAIDLTWLFKRPPLDKKRRLLFELCKTLGVVVGSVVCWLFVLPALFGRRI